MLHLAILHPRYIDSILAGEKTIESRFSRHRCEPYGRVSPGDTIYFQQRAGAIVARARVSRTRAFDDLTPARVRALRAEFNDQILAPAAYWRAKRSASYATLIWIHRVEAIPGALDPRTLTKFCPGRAWYAIAA